MNVFIYALCEPDSGLIRYVGKAKNIHRRVSRHLTNARHGKRNHRTCWLRGLLAEGLRPVLEILDEVPDSEWPMWEAAYIQFYKEAGFNLVNGTDGGEAGPIMRGANHPFFGKKLPQETCAKISAARKGIEQGPHSEAWNKKIGAGCRGKKRTAEAIARMSAAQKGKPKSLHQREAQSRAKKGLPWSPARREAQNKKLL